MPRVNNPNNVVTSSMLSTPGSYSQLFTILTIEKSTDLCWRKCGWMQLSSFCWQNFLHVYLIFSFLLPKESVSKNFITYNVYNEIL